MINITQKNINSISLSNCIELCQDARIHILYKPKGYTIWFLDGFTLSKLQEVISKNVPYVVISISEDPTKDELTNISLKTNEEKENK